MRTPEQIAADLEARYAALRFEAERRKRDPQINFPCETCRWHTVEYMGTTCAEPLTKGFGTGHRLTSWAQAWPNKLCGPEKALWQPRRNFLQRLIDWLASFWGNDNG